MQKLIELLKLSQAEIFNSFKNLKRFETIETFETNENITFQSFQQMIVAQGKALMHFSSGRWGCLELGGVLVCEGFSSFLSSGFECVHFPCWVV